MSAVTASIASATSSMLGKARPKNTDPNKVKAVRNQFAEGQVPKHGDEAHTGGAVAAKEETIQEPVTDMDTGAVIEGRSAAAFKSSPAKIKKSPTSYTPFRMAAADHNNSPIEKNFGTPAHRGISSFGVGGLYGGVNAKSQSETGIAAPPKHASPAKGFFSSIANVFKPKNVKKKIDSVLGLGKPEDAAAAAAGGGGARPHTHDPNTGQVVQGGGGGGAAIAASTPSEEGGPMDPRAARIAQIQENI